MPTREVMGREDGQGRGEADEGMVDGEVGPRSLRAWDGERVGPED